MAIILKKKLAPKLDIERPLSVNAALIDEIGEMEPEAAKLAARIKKLQDELKPFSDKEKQLEAAIPAEYAEEDDDGEFTALGNKAQIHVGKKGNERKIVDMDRVRKFLTPAVFMQVCTVPLKEVDKYLSGAQKDECITTNRVKRTLGAVETRND